LTLGFASAAWIAPDPPVVMIAADTRLSASQQTFTDAGIKTFDLGGRAAMVAAGSALPALTAAELVRTIVVNHNRREPDRRLGFYDTMRLLAFFLKRSAEQQQARCEVGVAGFLASGVPAVARVVVSPERNRVSFVSIEPGGKIAIPVGERSGRALLLRGMETARREGRPVLASGLSLLWYMAKHQGAFQSIGGGISVGSCQLGEDYFSWPVVELENHRFLRGLDVTACHRPGWPEPVRLQYDEAWCAATDRAVEDDLDPPVRVERGGGYDVDSMSTAETLFQTHDDPVAFDAGIARSQGVSPAVSP
jgi:hypothetical protein